MSAQQTRRQGRSAGPSGVALRTWVFDSVGPNKYALQLRKASNGNPNLRLVQGVPSQDGSFRRWDITIWSEDFDTFFRMVDEVRAWIGENNIRTPEGHRYVPGRSRRVSTANRNGGGGEGRGTAGKTGRRDGAASSAPPAGSRRP